VLAVQKLMAKVVSCHLVYYDVALPTGEMTKDEWDYPSSLGWQYESISWYGIISGNKSD